MNWTINIKMTMWRRTIKQKTGIKITTMNRFAILSLFVLTVAIIGCNTQKTVVKKYYVLETPDDTTYVDTTRGFINEFCEVDKVAIYPAFETRQIANRSQSNQITYYSSHEWAVRPTEVLTNMLVDFMERKKMFRRVATRYWKVSPAYKIEATIFRLEVVNEDKELAAHLKMELRLVDGDTQEVIRKHKTDQYKTMEEKKINVFASMISEMYYSALNDFSDKIYKHFEERDKIETKS